MEGDTSPEGRGLGDTSPEGRVSPLGINNVVIKIGTTFIPGRDRNSLPRRQGKNNQIEFEMANEFRYHQDIASKTSDIVPRIIYGGTFKSYGQRSTSIDNQPSVELLERLVNLNYEQRHEVCIEDLLSIQGMLKTVISKIKQPQYKDIANEQLDISCLLYTSDAADE